MQHITSFKDYLDNCHLVQDTLVHMETLWGQTMCISS